VIAPWREWDLTSRTKLLEFAEANQIPIAKDKRGEAPFSRRCEPAAHLIRGQGAGKPGRGSARLRLSAHRLPEDAPDTPEYIEIGFERGDAVAINGVALSPATILTRSERIWPQARHRPAGFRRKPFCRHEVARHL
jgi:argininosuccinate synthase